MNKNIKLCACKYENIFELHITPQNKQQFDGGESGIFCLFVGDNHARFWGLAKHLLNFHKSTFL